jgi:hypothetical protein
MCFLFALLAATSFEATVTRCGAASSLRILRAIRLRVRILDDGAERTGEPGVIRLRRHKNLQGRR